MAKGEYARVRADKNWIWWSTRDNRPASYREVIKEIEARGYEWTVDNPRDYLHWDTQKGGITTRERQLLQKGAIQKVQVYRNSRVDGKIYDDGNIEYRVWLHTEEELYSPDAQLSEKMQELKKLFNPEEHGQLTGKLDTQNQEHNAERDRDSVDIVGIWRGVAVFTKDNGNTYRYWAVGKPQTGEPADQELRRDDVDYPNVDRKKERPEQKRLNLA